MIRKSTTARKQQGKALASAPNMVSKVALKRKCNVKDDCLSKKTHLLWINNRNPLHPLVMGLVKV